MDTENKTELSASMDMQTDTAPAPLDVPGTEEKEEFFEVEYAE